MREAIHYFIFFILGGSCGAFATFVFRGAVDATIVAENDALKETNAFIQGKLAVVRRQVAPLINKAHMHDQRDSGRRRFHDSYTVGVDLGTCRRLRETLFRAN